MRMTGMAAFMAGAFALALTGCGGGGARSPNAGPPATQTPNPGPALKAAQDDALAAARAAEAASAAAIAAADKAEADRTADEAAYAAARKAADNAAAAASEARAASNAAAATDDPDEAQRQRDLARTGRDRAQAALTNATAFADTVADKAAEKTVVRAERLPFPFEAEFCDDFRTSCPAEWDPRRPGLSIRALPDADRSEARHSPVTHDWRRIFVGVDQGADHIGTLPVRTQRGSTEIRFGAVTDGAGKAKVEEYLSYVVPGRTIFIDVHKVTVIGDATQEERNRVLAAVRMVNAALPEAAKLTVEAPRPGFDIQDDDPLPNRIHVEFLDGGNPDYPNAAGLAYTYRGRTQYAHVTIFNRVSAGVRERSSIYTIAHEIMHSLGFGGHVPHGTSFRSVMTPVQPPLMPGDQPWPPLTVLWPADREALRALYSADPSDLGSWSATSLHIHGNGPHAGYGVAFRNGYAEPWAYGLHAPDTLSENQALGGSATWTGHLVGFTPAAEPVTGEAVLTVDIAALTGTAAFTGLEQWAARQAPGDAGEGAMWGDGDLNYSIAVRGQTFRETTASEDAGRLTGAFTGPAHEGAAGTLERTDLTAAFGASRM